MTTPYHSRKYSLNEHFFSTWSPEMAYVFGFWCADGDMKKEKSYRVSFSSKDIQILKDIKYAAGSNARIYNVNLHGKPQDHYYLTLHSKRLHLDLANRGGRRNNSRTITFPKIPAKYLQDFIRGYFDGDGSVHEITYKATKNGKVYTEIRSNFTSGSKVFLSSLRKILLSRVNLANRTIGQYGPYQFKLGYGQKDTHKLLKFIYYPGHKLSLHRKAVYLDKFDK